MAQSYGLSIETDLNAKELLKFVSTVKDFEWNGTFLLGSGMLISVFPETSEGQSIMEEAFGFKPSVSIGFRMQPISVSEAEIGKLTMLQVTIEILKLVTGDSVLLFNGEIILLQRFNNQLLLNQDYALWRGAALAEITITYELKSLPSPLL